MVLKIAVVPSDVRCLRVTVTGPGRTVEREIETAGDTTLTQSLSGLPLGTVTFLGEAFTAACSSVSKSTIAAWTSQPVETSIVLGRLATVELVMTRNGRAKVEITFNEEGACTAVGQPCRIPSECCSKEVHRPGLRGRGGLRRGARSERPRSERSQAELHRPERSGRVPGLGRTQRLRETRTSHGPALPRDCSPSPGGAAARRPVGPGRPSLAGPFHGSA